MAIGIELIKKDFFLLKTQLFAYGGLMVAALAMMTIPIEMAGQVGSIVLIFAFVAFYSNLVMKAVISERKDNNHLFLMTLPVTSRQLARLKLASVLLMFFSLWLPGLALVLLFLINSPHWPGVALALFTAGFAIYLPAFALILAVAFITLSEPMTILAFVISNMAVAIFLNYLPQADFMQHAFEQGSALTAGIIWPDQINAVLLLAGGTFTALVALCYWVGARERGLAD